MKYILRRHDDAPNKGNSPKSSFFCYTQMVTQKSRPIFLPQSKKVLLYSHVPDTKRYPQACILNSANLPKQQLNVWLWRLETLPCPRPGSR
mmetsp:Transcript_11524/g.17476  ORF Transcript_11524/g.17476 Transcript_11524/m.17476 type:complete len:91 (-) Transcript_11524:1043-1315(-)